ncbi:MAG: hypothetical protein COW26_01825 [Nitrosopumilales archaeon CG15_BIG_FIL_POST_REV_8_21_14_020_33_23]|jgi:hypothetical protein|nr:MAG: hypothetical protein COV65_06460 [Nitrosopumilales archaeon CG11_big_fil_rev_8_21_14_0_20_33_24]PIW35921.1 MAG: hypothetical protein COW26_01825 [Nitrosopumilales archaeon CG15_BIG_FIL_POST_REV_8_21_14_020_33_23]PIY88604.1 MAG: hypothetical protein COY74_08080 [Nitrosopumilales archaeon CG_4_10_14_0_8_um_filter_34_8]PJB98856.1 MAG: hypothetical protein CO079_01315 [Nitrosopumilales archaeon CG_4_9_14_0_8_um_filter_34_10]
MKPKKKKHIVRIISPHSEHYVSLDDQRIDFQLNSKQDTPKQKNIDKRSIKDLKNTNYYKLNSKKIQSRQNHSPVYE